jgi:hypothetical protein
VNAVRLRVLHELGLWGRPQIDGVGPLGRTLGYAGPAVGFVQGRRGREIARPAEVLAQKHSKALLNFKTFIVYKYIRIQNKF